MTNEEFVTKVDAKLTECYKLMKEKNEAYKSASDPMNNFTQFANLAHQTREQALLSFAGKQIVQVYNTEAIKTDPSYRERIMDIINYMAILLVMLDEE